MPVKAREVAGLMLAGVLAPAGAAWAQEQTEPLERVEPAVEDFGPLSASLREMQVDLRQPSGFEDVYRVPEQAELYMRVSGGLYAIFPRAVYVPTRGGVVPLVPADTVFYIGEPFFIGGAAATGADDSSRAGPALFPRLGQQIDSAYPSADVLVVRPDAQLNESWLDREHLQRRVASQPESRVSTVVNNPQYRRQRLTELLERAAQAEAAGERKAQSDARG